MSRSAVTCFSPPLLGVQAQTDRSILQAPFTRVDTSAFVACARSGGTAHGHDYAVQFNYPAELSAADPGMVAAITVNMSVALIPSEPASQFARLDRPFGLWIGSEDELFVPNKVLAFADRAVFVRDDSQVGELAGAKHLSVLLSAHEPVGAWITRRLPR